jgi:C-terminal regulatory domain of Threonine dehydratase
VFPRNVTEFSYRYHDGERARILLSYQSLPGVSRAADAVAVQEALAAADYDVTDLSGNELAKVCSSEKRVVLALLCTSISCSATLSNASAAAACSKAQQPHTAVLWYRYDTTSCCSCSCSERIVCQSMSSSTSMLRCCTPHAATHHYCSCTCCILTLRTLTLQIYNYPSIALCCLSWYNLMCVHNTLHCTAGSCASLCRRQSTISST